MVLLGTIVNAAAILFGTFIGSFLTKIPDRIKQTVTKAIALAVVVLGIKMALQGEQFLVVILSLAIGGVIGEWLDLEKRLNNIGYWLERKVGSRGEGGNVAKAFVTATLVFVVGALSILGALDSGLRQDHTILYTKAMLDGFFSILFTTTLGIGVLFSAVPVLIYEGGIALFATQINQWVAPGLLDLFISEMTAVGGIMILAIGLNLLEITKIRTANLLPGLVVVALLCGGLYYW
ncbi:MAG TPA: DUF554 domain-containing protein [Bacillales bacterium]|nr:DUF554 domain-containing protein [Bacillales bacterium]